MYTQNFLDELSARNDIVDVIGSYVALQKKGGNYFGLCPFHNEKTPSFSVSPSKQIYHCFGCKKGGSVITFIMEVESLSFPEAIQFLAKRANMELPEEDQHDIDTRRFHKRLLELNREAARWYYDTLQSPKGAAVQAYLDQRQIRKGVATRFGLGASTPNWDDLSRAMIDRGYSKKELLSAGLAVAGKGGRLYDKFRNRLMLPVIDTRGEVVGFGSRALSSEDKPKYLNTGETSLFAKRYLLYGLNLAKKTKRPNIILCEGNLDVVTLHQAGFDNAVASMGTALTNEHIQLLSRYTKELILCYDNDHAGQMATQRALELLDHSDFTVRVLKLPNKIVDGKPEKQDPDDFIKAYGAAAFENLLGGSENGIEFRLAQVAGNYDLTDDRQRVAYAKEISDVLCTLSNAVEREIYTVRAAETAGFSPEAMRNEVGRAYKRRINALRKKREKRELNPAAIMQPDARQMRYENLRSAMAEEGVIRLFLMDDSIFPPNSPLAPEDFSSPLLGKIYAELWQHRGNMYPLTALGAVLSSEEMGHLTALIQKPESPANAPQVLQDYIRIILQEKQKENLSDAELLALAREKYKDKKKYGGNQT